MAAPGADGGEPVLRFSQRDARIGILLKKQRKLRLPGNGLIDLCAVALPVNSAFDHWPRFFIAGERRVGALGEGGLLLAV